MSASPRLRVALTRIADEHTDEAELTSTLEDLEKHA
jgi:hypothetical protein